MIYPLLFGSVQLAVTAYAFWRGGWPERTVGAAMILAFAAGLIVPFQVSTSFRHLEWARLAIDMALWATIHVVALRADRFWPIWMSAVALLAVGIHGVRRVNTSMLPMAYHQLIEWMAYAMIAMLIIGTGRYHERRAAGSSARGV